MSARQEVLAEGILSTKTLLARFLPGFDDTNHTRQAPGLPNHLAWNLGHLAVTMARAHERLNSTPPPDTDFAPGPRGDAERFGLESVAFGSNPADDRAAYPKCSRCIKIFDAACDRLAAAIRAASDAQLDKPAKWGAGEIPTWMLMLRMVFHNGNHCGQIVDLRRALNLGRVLG